MASYFNETLVQYLIKDSTTWNSVLMIIVNCDTMLHLSQEAVWTLRRAVGVNIPDVGFCIPSLLGFASSEVANGN